MAVTVLDDYQQHVSDYRGFLHLLRVIVLGLALLLLVLAATLV